MALTNDDKQWIKGAILRQAEQIIYERQLCQNVVERKAARD